MPELQYETEGYRTIRVVPTRIGADPNDVVDLEELLPGRWFGLAEIGGRGVSIEVGEVPEGRHFMWRVSATHGAVVDGLPAVGYVSSPLEAAEAAWLALDALEAAPGPSLFDPERERLLAMFDPVEPGQVSARDSWLNAIRDFRTSEGAEGPWLNFQTSEGDES